MNYINKGASSAFDLINSALNNNFTKALGLSAVDVIASFIIAIPTSAKYHGKKITNLSFAIDHLMPNGSKEIVYQLLASPIVRTREIFENTLSFEFCQVPVSFCFYTGLLEEAYYRGLIQRIVLPKIANSLPPQIAEVLNHSVTRVAITSLLFGLAHIQHWESSNGFAPQFIGGCLNGAVAEITNSLAIPIISHTLSDVLGLCLSRYLSS